MKDFYYGTTKAFDIIVYVNGEPHPIGPDTVTLILKNNKKDSDEDAVLFKEAYETTNEGVAKFTLSADETKLPPSKYYYEIKWINDTNVYILESSTVSVLERVFD